MREEIDKVKCAQCIIQWQIEEELFLARSVEKDRLLHVHALTFDLSHLRTDTCFLLFHINPDLNHRINDVTESQWRTR